MKKTLAIILALAMVFSTLTVAFAEETIGVDAQACATLGMLKGEGSGVTADYVATTPNRLTAAILFLRLKGLEDEALAYTGTENFADADQVNWAGGRAILGYLKTNTQLGWIGDNGNFKANDPMTAQQYYKVMLEALGYKQNTASVIGDFTFDGTIEFAAAHGLTKVATVTNYTVNDLAIATMEALKANVKDSTTKTLAVSLVEAGVIAVDAATTVGLYTPTPVALVVDSVTATNLKQITVKFNKEVDPTTAETAGNYVITTSGTAAMGTAALQADNKTVLITLGTDATQQENITLTVKNVEDAAGTAIETVDKELTFLDFTLPVAEKIELTGPEQFKVTFSEPIETLGTVLVENGVYGATPVISGNVATVALGADLTEGSYKVKVTGFKDYAGYEALAQEFTLTYVKDTTAVVATVKEAKQTYVLVEFNKAVNGTLTVNNFYHTFTAWKPTAVLDADGNALAGGTYYKTVKLTFPVVGGFPIPAGTTKLAVLRAEDLGNEVIDQWGNTMTEDANLSVTVTSDTTAPTITKVEATYEDTLEVYFNEDVLEADAETAANYVIKDSEGKVVTPTINTMDYTTSSDKVIIVLTAPLSGGAYTVEIKDIKDISIAENKLATTQAAFTVTDKTPATIANAVVVETLSNSADEYIYLTFSEAMATSGEGSILDIKNYQLDGAAMPDGAKVELFGSNKKVKITVPDQTLTLVGPSRLTVGKLADVVGNKIVAFSTPVAIFTDAAPVVASVKSIALNQIQITVTGILSTVPANGIKVDANNDGTTVVLAAVSFVTDETNNKTTITGTLSATDVLGGPAAKVAAVEIVASKIKSQTGKYMVADADVFTGAVLPAVDATNKDGVGPAYTAIADAVAGDNQFEVAFNESLVEIAAGLTATEFTLVDADGNTLVANVDYSTTISGADVIFTLVGDYDGYTGKMTVSTKTAVTYFGDDLDASTTFQPGVENAAKAFTGKTVTVQ